MSYSPLIRQLIDALRCLPGVGPKSAQRMAFYLLERGRDRGQHLAKTLEQAMIRVNHCQFCRTLTEEELCTICKNPYRDRAQLCVVETPADVHAIEQTGSYRGLYYVLMGHLSPIDGIGPAELAIDLLLKRVVEHSIKEIILATNPTVEGDVTAHYIADQVKPFSVIASRIAYGVPLGGELEWIDGGTIARAFSGRVRLATD